MTARTFSPPLAGHALGVMLVMLLGSVLCPGPVAVLAQTTAPAAIRPKCSYNFLVPEPDLIDNCQKYADKQLVSLREQLASIKERLANLTGGSVSDEDQSDLKGLQFQCACNNRTRITFAFRDCQDVKALTGGLSGLYDIEPIRSTGKLIHVDDLDSAPGETQRYWLTKTWPAIQVYCDLEEELVGWTIILRRSFMNVTFDRDWYSYKHGFGSAEAGGDFWLGLENVHRITSQAVGTYSLWLVVTDGGRVPHVYPYDTFSLDAEEEDFAIRLDGYHGSLTSLLSSNQPFTTRDHQPPEIGKSTYGRINCASSDSSKVSGGGWWFSGDGTRYYYYSNDYDCGKSNLFASPPVWSGFSNVTRVEMKIRPES